MSRAAGVAGCPVASPRSQPQLSRRAIAIRRYCCCRRLSAPRHLWRENCRPSALRGIAPSALLNPLPPHHHAAIVRTDTGLDLATARLPRLIAAALVAAAARRDRRELVAQGPVSRSGAEAGAGAGAGSSHPISTHDEPIELLRKDINDMQTSLLRVMQHNTLGRDELREFK
ncbi:hypothetical protein Scep_005077 [Stephania cephalantha]|uniref:Uncharacterized protein n=1 Tax=Stephania cephalantha TaxID=152367 RepID=A0AAP0KTL9_9MAGN